MSYGKYGMKNNDFANTAYNDPMFALGQLIASNWSKNYEDRGRAKALAEIEAQLSSNPTKQELSDATQQQQTNNETAAKQTLGALPSEQVDNLVTQYGGIKGKVAGDLLNDPNNFTGNDEFSKYMSNAAQDTKNQVQAAQTLGYVPKTVGDAGIAAANDYAGTAQPVMDSNGNVLGLAAKQGIGDIAQQAADNRLTNFNADKFLADQTVNLLKKGYSKDDIETMLAPVAIKAKGLQTEQNEQVMQQLLPLYTTLINAGKYNEANQLALSAYKYNPEMAKALVNGNVSVKDQYNEANAEKKQDKNFFYSDKLNANQFVRSQEGADNDVIRFGQKTGITSAAKMQELNAKANLYISLGYSPKDAYMLALGGTGSSKSAANNSGITSQQYQAAKAISDDYDKWVASNIDPNATYPGNMDDVKYAKSLVVAAMRGGLQNVPQSNSGNNSSIDYNKANSEWTAALKTNQQKGGANKWSRAKLESFARDRYGDLADNIIENTEWAAFGL